MTRLPLAMVRLAAHLLPHASRRRYVAEFEADLRELPNPRRLSYAVSTLVGAPRLRWEVLQAATGGHALLCFVGRHQDRRVHTRSADPMVFALECGRCRRIRDPRQYASRPRMNDLPAWYSANDGS